jgi:poly-gamma-glutamate capsule biosynthesis protein CapA/YwtB (metallophosphatase superfamily)
MEIPVKIAFIGDISLNGKYSDLYKLGRRPFDAIKDYLAKSDFVVGNLECLAQGEKGENLLQKPRLKTSVDTFGFLKDLNVGLVTLAHNHIYDNLFDGYKKTLKFLKENKILYLGAGTDHHEAAKPRIVEIKSKKFCFLNCLTADVSTFLPPDAKVAPNFYDREKIIAEVTKYKNVVDFIILLLHWGGRTEGFFYPDFYQISEAKKLIENGVDLIIGHHSHTLQPFEKQDGKYIFYSLGNFCFDDVRSDNKLYELNWDVHNKSVIVNASFTSSGYGLDLIPVRNNKYDMILDESILKELKRRNALFRIIKKSRLIWMLNYYKVKYYDRLVFYFFGNDRYFIQQLKKLDISKLNSFLRH